MESFFKQVKTDKSLGSRIIVTNNFLRLAAQKTMQLDESRKRIVSMSLNIIALIINVIFYVNVNVL